MVVVVSENSTDSEGKDQDLSQQIESSGKVVSVVMKYFLIFKMLMPSGVWVAFML